jgi:hypothetical protein
MKFHRRMNRTALLVTILGFRNKNKHSQFWYLTSQQYLLYKFRLKKDKPWVFFSKFRWRTILMHFLLVTTNMWQIYTRPTSASDFSIQNLSYYNTFNLGSISTSTPKFQDCKILQRRNKRTMHFGYQCSNYLSTTQYFQLKFFAGPVEWRYNLSRLPVSY